MIYSHFSPPHGPLPCSLSHLLFKYCIAILQKMKLILTFSSIFRHYNHLQLLLISHDLLSSRWSLPYTKHLLFYLQARCMCMYAYIYRLMGLFLFLNLPYLNYRNIFDFIQFQYSLWLKNNFNIYIYFIFYLFIHLSINTKVCLIAWLLWIVLHKAWLCQGYCSIMA